MTLEELADLIRAVSANTNGRVDAMRNESNTALMNIQNDLTDVRSDIAEIRRTLDFTPLLSAMQKQDRRTRERSRRTEAPRAVTGAVAPAGRRAPVTSTPPPTKAAM